MLTDFEVKTNKEVELTDITYHLKEIIKKTGVDDGIMVIYSPHTTAGITINEGADSDVVRDLIMEINKVIPFKDNYRHFEGNSAAHIKNSLVGTSETVIIKDGQINLGRWQSVYFCEFDGPRQRKVFVKVIEG